MQHHPSSPHLESEELQSEIRLIRSRDDLAIIDRSARLAIWAIARIDMSSLRFSERQRLARILVRLESVAGEAHDVLGQVQQRQSADSAVVVSRERS